MKPLFLSAHFRRLKLGFFLLCGLLLQACTPTPPESVAGDFWTAALLNDKQTVSALTLPSNFDIERFDDAHYSELFDHASIGEVTSERRKARVQTRLEGPLQTIEFDTIAVIHKRKWRVDYAATSHEMIAALLSNSADEINTSIQSDIRVLDKSIGDAIRDEWHTLDKDLNNN